MQLNQIISNTSALTSRNDPENMKWNELSAAAAAAAAGTETKLSVLFQARGQLTF